MGGIPLRQPRPGRLLGAVYVVGTVGAVLDVLHQDRPIVRVVAVLSPLAVVLIVSVALAIRNALSKCVRGDS